MPKPYYEDEPEKMERSFLPRKKIRTMTPAEYDLREGFKGDLKKNLKELPANLAGFFSRKSEGKGAIRGAIKKLMKEQFGGDK
jgi:hypothetical protein